MAIHEKNQYILTVATSRLTYVYAEVKPVFLWVDQLQAITLVIIKQTEQELKVEN